ncbi:MAG: outer membrane protein transport protein [bacterium]|nr:outer membrane protein transport protein [bacterium]
MPLARLPLCFIVLCLLPTLSMAQMSPLDVGITLPPSFNFATSPNPVGSGARAAGKAFAFIGVADDATAASWNPAGLVQLQQPEASVVGSFFIRLEDHDITQQGFNQGVIAIDGQSIDAINLNYLSVVYPFELLKRNIVVSLSFQRLFDLNGQTDVTSGFTEITGVQQVNSEQDGGLWTISPAVAVQVTPAFSLGLAFNIWPDLFGNGWEQDVDVQSSGFVASGGSTVPFVSTGRIREEFDFEGFNVTIGLLWTINRIFTVGAVLRTPFEAKLTRKHSSSLDVTLDPGGGNNTVSTGLDFKEKLDMDMPLSYGIGVAARLSDNLTLSLDVSRVHWSDFKLEDSSDDDKFKLLVENGAPSGKGKAVLDGEADDTTSVRLGAEYLLIKRNLLIPLRTGFFYDPEPGDGGIDNFYGFTLGSGITINRFVFDLAYQLRTGTVDSAALDSTITQHSIIASVIYHF